MSDDKGVNNTEMEHKRKHKKSEEVYDKVNVTVRIVLIFCLLTVGKVWRDRITEVTAVNTALSIDTTFKDFIYDGCLKNNMYKTNKKIRL